VIGIQNDFVEGGALASVDTKSLFEPLNAALAQAHKFGHEIVLARDWHPQDHFSFDDWPTHCVQGTTGAEFHPNLIIPEGSSPFVVDIGFDNDVDGYSPLSDFRLLGLLASKQIRTIYVTGIALEFCVLATCRDALWFGHPVVAIEPLIRSARSEPAQKEFVWEFMRSMGVVRSQDVPTFE
jgi:nicotinamidase/pyrazinamidase